jgi:hypothetical protein
MARLPFRSPLKAFVAVLSATCFLTFAQGAATFALAADPVQPPGTTWETWPPKKPLPGVEPAPGTAGEFAGGKTSSGISAGTWGWIAGGAAAAILIGVAAGGGGGGSSTTTTAHH